jgi:lipopolysaccharide export system protein LptA
MRGAPWLLLLAICAIVGWLGFTYRIQKRALEQQAPARPDPLPAGISGASRDWYHRETDENGRTRVEIWAKNFKQEKDTSKIELERVRLHIVHTDGNQYDIVESPLATFQPNENRLYAEGEVLITLKVPTDGPPSHRLVSIHTSGVTFDKKTAIASTDRPADFTFENGTGKCVGATYDPNTKELQMRSNVELNLRGRGQNGQPMKLEAGQLVYREQESYIVLSPWVRLKRDTSTLEGSETVVVLKDGAIEKIEAQNAKGIDVDGNRSTEYSADRLTVNYTPEGDVDKVNGEPNARVVSTTEAASTTTTSNKIDLAFESENHKTILKSAFASGHAEVESKPLAGAAGKPLPDTRILRSEMIELKMQPDGREIAEVNTHSPGHIDFLPNQPGGRRRQMDGDRIYITYGPRNIIQSFRSENVRTRTDPATKSGAPLETSSKNMLAEFDPGSGQMLRIKQSDDFRYTEGQRRAVASQATLEQNTNVVILETGARVWDPTGATAADLIRLDQATGNFSAEGHVSSSRAPDKKTPESGLLSGGEPIQATAQRMLSRDRNTFIRYDGQADMWQGASRIRADRIEIDREARRLVAAGSVHTQLLEREKSATPAKPGALSIFTIVKAAGLVYTEGDRLAHYTGGVLLNRPDLQVKSLELRSYLAEAGADSSLERAYADGKVEIRQSAPGRMRTGTSEHAEYYVTDQKVILRGGAPKLTDSLKGATQGSELTYYAGDDRLLVNGAPEQPAKSRIRRK